MRLIIVEKPFLLDRIKETGVLNDGLDTDIIFTYGIGLWRFSKHKVNFNDIPYTGNPTGFRPSVHKAINPFVKLNKNPIVSIKTEPLEKDYKEGLNDVLNHIKSKISLYNEIVIAAGESRRSLYSAKQIIDMIGNIREVPVNYMKIIATDRDSIEKSWSNRKDNQWKESYFEYVLAHEGYLKRLFDYWWNANSSLVFSELCAISGLKTNYIMSKYELMFICLVASEWSQEKESDILRLMSKWKGTGKYKGQYNGEIGSPMSRNKIIETAISRGAISTSGETEEKIVEITEKGKLFISKLHPRTFDADLPFRLEDWIKNKNNKAMARYIRTVFGRQIKYQRKN